MNAIISLCHFCENHGPSILFCTQAFQSQNVEDVNQSSHSNETDSSENERECVSISSNVEHGLNKSESKYETGIQETPVEAKAATSTTGNYLPKTEAKCEACRSLPSRLPGFVSYDHEAKMRYISSQHPSHTQIFSMVRQACLRSLSSEVSPSREGPGPIFFGDENSGHVLSHVFIVKDSQYSRGFQRRYSIIVVMMDKIFLLNSWPFLVKHIKDIIEELQAKALKVYESEQAKSPASARSQRIIPGGTIPALARVPINPGKPARSFVELTGDKHIFKKLHQTFTWLIKAGGTRLTEKLLEGPPTEDSIIDVENHEETEEGFVLVESKKDMEEPEDLFQNHSSGDFTEDEEDGEDCPTFRDLRHLLKIFGYSKFHKVSHHVAIGNQIIVRGRQKKLVKSVIECLKVLLPKGCCRVTYFSQHYEESWKCNFLGLHQSAAIPDLIESYVVIDIHAPDKGQGQNDDEVQDAMMSLGLGEKEFGGYVFTVSSLTKLPEKEPTVLNKMEYLLLTDNLADSVVEQGIICLKEEWMNKVKVLFKFTRAGGNRSEEDTQGLLKVVGAEEDGQLLKFWRKGLSAQYKNHMFTSNIYPAGK